MSFPLGVNKVEVVMGVWLVTIYNGVGDLEVDPSGNPVFQVQLVVNIDAF